MSGMPASTRSSGPRLGNLPEMDGDALTTPATPACTSASAVARSRSSWSSTTMSPGPIRLSRSPVRRSTRATPVTPGRLWLERLSSAGSFIPRWWQEDSPQCHCHAGTSPAREIVTDRDRLSLVITGTPSPGTVGGGDYGARVNRTDRLYAIVEDLRAIAPRPRTARNLATRYEVSVRTIERDISALQQAGVPIYATTGRRGGYSLDPAMTLPPLNF